MMRIDRLHQRTVDRLQLLESQRRQTWLYPGFSPPAAALNVMWIIQGANVIPSPPTTGILYVATNITAASLPVPVVVPTPAPGDIVEVDAASPPGGMPDGIGTAKAFGSSKRRFALNDNRISGVTRDLRAGDKVYAADEIVLSKVSGGVTYNYTCLLVEATA